MQGTLTFTRSTDVVADEERPGLLRARHAPDDDAGATHLCDLRDLAVPGTAEPGLENAGFETVDLTGNQALQRALAEVRQTDQITDSVDAAIRSSLTGTHFALRNGASLHVDLVVDDGLFHRRSGPNWLDVNPGGIDGINGFGGAQFVHGDQDVFGTPLRQLLHGAAPDMFRHVTPDGRNDDATTFLLNLWIPIHAPVQPLALMDRGTLDARRHQLRYGLPVEGFLDRDAEESVNDIWNFLHDPDQQWYIHTDMGPDSGYVFDTLGTPHGAAALAGEDALEELYLALHRRCEAYDRGAAAAAHPDPPTLVPPVDASPTIRAAWQRMAALINAAPDGTAPGDTASGHTTEEWCDQARAAMDSVIRRSIELRLVATLIDT